MTIKERIAAALKDLVAPAVEIEVKKQVEAHSDEYVDLLLAKMASLIPGNFDDNMIAQVAPKLKADMKAYLLAQADKISDKV